MKCYICGKGIDEGLSLIPIYTKSEGRRWVCLEHSEGTEIPKDVRDICSIFDDKFKEEK